jgi:hypothetical protein
VNTFFKNVIQKLLESITTAAAADAENKGVANKDKDTTAATSRFVHTAHARASPHAHARHTALMRACVVDYMCTGTC